MGLFVNPEVFSATKMCSLQCRCTWLRERNKKPALRAPETYSLPESGSLSQDLLDRRKHRRLFREKIVQVVCDDQSQRDQRKLCRLGNFGLQRRKNNSLSVLIRSVWTSRSCLERSAMSDSQVPDRVASQRQSRGRRLRLSTRMVLNIASYPISKGVQV